MITKIQTVEQLKQLFIEILLNKTDKLSDISDHSILNATAYGVAKIAQKAMKDIAIVESHLFPDLASGQYLDNSATLFGVSGRYAAAGSSTFIRLIASPGTQYISGTHIFKSNNGIQFALEDDITIGDLGWGYAKIRSLSIGKITNSEPNSIITVFPEPTGHVGCLNEYYAEGGSDEENDELFRLRIKKHLNILSKNTVAYYTEIFRIFNNNILRVVNLGNNEEGKRVLAIVLQNGQSLTQTDLDNLLDLSKSYFSVTDLNKFGNTIGIQLQNIEWEYVDVDFRVDILSNYNSDNVRKNIQANLTKNFDFRFWDHTKNVEWDDLLQIVKNTEGINYVPDNYFKPSIDIKVPIYKLPRIRGFIMRDINGNIISNNNNTILPIFYPA